MPVKKSQKNILWFKEINSADVPLVGGKNASLGEMHKHLAGAGVNLPDGFVLTSNAYWHYLKANNIDKKLNELFGNFDRKSLASLQKTGAEARRLIMAAQMPDDLQEGIIKNYRELSKKYRMENADVAVRSSATAEDLPTASFAGQHETFLNVRGEKELIEASKKSIASLFTDRAIAYREEKGFPHMKIALSVGVQKMVRSDKASAGVIFTLDTETGFDKVVLINSIYGIGEMIVKGKITPDEFFVFKPTLKEGYKPIIVKNLGRKTKEYVYGNGGLKEKTVPKSKQLKFSISDEEVLKLAEWACLIEKHYKRPQDIEWAKDGKSGQLFIVQARPETVHTQKKSSFYEEYEIKTDKKAVLTGTAIGDKIGQGRVRIIPDVSKISQFQKREVLVTKMTDPDWLPAMRTAAAIVSDEGGKTCFAGDTKIITNKGLISIKELVECSKKNYEVKVLSLNKNNLKIEWKSLKKRFKRISSLVQINVSQTGRIKDNTLKVTPDHNFLTFNNRELIKKEIINLIKEKRGVLSPFKIPNSNLKFNYSSNLAYLIGAISTDGSVFIKKYGRKLVAALYFIQKPTKEKEAFIKKVEDSFFEEFKHKLIKFKKPAGKGGIIKGRQIIGNGAIGLRCCNRKIVEKFLSYQKSINEILLGADEKFIFNFLAGIIDGDGTYGEKSNRINIYCSKDYLVQAVTIACLRLGINFQVSRNRNIHNLQIIDNVEEIFNYTKRVRGSYERIRFGVRFFNARQLLEDIILKVNYKGRVLPYIKNNLLIDAEKIRRFIIPMIKGLPENHALTDIINSPLKMLRVGLDRKLGKDYVYNIEVEDNHNYIVLTKKYTPIVVENCHAAIVARELGIPAIVGARNATKILKTGETVTVDCTQGLNGKVFRGKVPFRVKKYDLKKIPKVKTKIMVNVGAPETAFKTSFLPTDGVGLAREEFIIAEKVRVHPLALYHYKRLRDRKLKKEIEKITPEHRDKREFFVKELAEGIAQIASAFHPKEVIVRFSDFKSNEYKNLVGGELYEQEEQNPMLGFRGASRYLDKEFQPAFNMECQAIKRVRETFGLKNVSVMVPFCRTVEEGKETVRLIKKFGLRDKGMKIYVMCEIPSNVILAEHFLKVFDGMSIGSNDLTQLILGLDRDNASISHIGDERNEAVKKMISDVIKICKLKKKYVGICGQAPSDFPEFAEFLEKEGIDSISLNPDTVIKTLLHLTKFKI